MYTLNKNSRTSKFYSWIWNTDVSKFKTMCPYFWGYVITILLLPIILLVKLVFPVIPSKNKIIDGLVYIEKSNVGKLFKPSKFWDITSKIFKWIFFIGIGILLVTLIITFAITVYKEPLFGLFFLIACLVFIGLITLIAFLQDEHNLGSRLAYPFRLFKNMIYSLYKNVCPLIKWEY